MPRSRERSAAASAGGALHTGDRARPQQAGANVDRPALLLERLLLQLLDLLAHAGPTPESCAAALSEALHDPALLGARLDLPPPYPRQLVAAHDQQRLAPALAGAILPVQRERLYPHSAAWPAVLPPEGTLLVLPLASRDKYAGQLSLWLREDEDDLSRASEQAALALARALLAGAEQVRLLADSYNLEELQQAMLELGASLDAPQLQRCLLATALHIFRCRQVWYLPYNETHKHYTSGELHDPLPESAIQAIESAIASRRPSAVVTPESQESFACGSVAVGAQPMGLLLLQRDDPFSPHELTLLERLALSAGQGLRNVRIYQDSQETFAELRNALDQLIQAERLKALGEIARGVAHDFNNLLTIISSHTQFLLEAADPEQLQELEQIRSAIREGEDTVGRLRQFTRAAIEAPQQLVSLKKLLLEVRQLILPLLARLETQRNARITLELQLNATAQLPGNPAEIREMVMQLVHNSIDALPTGGTIWLRTWQEDTYACLQIRDDGIGMAEEVRRRVFDPFFTTKALRGTGLGLSMVHGVVRRHGGAIDVASTPSAGTAFTIRLPLVRGTLLAESEQQSDPNSSLE